MFPAGNPIIDEIPEGDISDEVNSANSQIEQQSQDDNNATEVDNNITEQSKDIVLDDATHPEKQHKHHTNQKQVRHSQAKASLHWST